MPSNWDDLELSGSSSSFTAQFDDPFLGPGGMGTLETCFHGNKKTSGGIFFRAQFDGPFLGTDGMGTMEICFHGNKKTCGGIFYGDGRTTQDPFLTPWKNPISGATPSPDVAPEIGLGDMDESEPEATIDEIEDMDMMNALAATINGHKKRRQQHQCLPFFPWMKNKKDCRPKVHITPQEKKRILASMIEGLSATMMCATSSTKSNKNKSWSMRHRYSCGANKKKRRGGLASKFHTCRQKRGATLQVQAKLDRLDRLLR